MKTTKPAMRISNKRVVPYIEFIYTMLIIGLFSSVLLMIIPVGLIVKYIPAYFLFIIFLIIIAIVYLIGHQLFEYSSDGEVLNIKTQDAFLQKIRPNSGSLVDFPKHKLSGFKIKKFLFLKTLELYVSSKRNTKGQVKLKFNITYLSNSEISDLKRSLNKIVNRNNEEKKEVAA